MTTQRDRRYHTIEEVADILRCSLSSVRWYLHTGRLQSIRPARRRLIPVEALEAFIALGSREAAGPEGP